MTQNQTLLLSRPLKIQAIVIDLDGTMVDTQGDFVVALNAMLDDLQLPHVDEGFVSVTVGKGTTNLIRKTLEQVIRAPVDDELLSRATLRYVQHYRHISGRFSTLYPGVIEGLKILHEQGYALACLTNKPSALAGPLMVEKGLADFFNCVFGGDAFIRQKPDPLPLQRTCEALGSLPAQTLMVGDSINDASAARSAKCPIALVRYGYNHGHPVEEVGADLYIDRLTDLPALITKV